MTSTVGNALRVDLSTPPPDLDSDFVVPGFQSGTLGSLIAPSGRGKGYFALEMAMAVASGGLADPLGIQPRKGGKVLYIYKEDPKTVISHRIYDIGQHLCANARQAVAANMDIRCMYGLPFDLLTDCEDIIDFVMPNDVQCKQGDEHHSEYRLIVLDTLTRLYTPNDESGQDIINVLNNISDIARRTGVAVLVLHRNAPYVARETAKLVAYSSWCGYMAALTQKEAQVRGIDDQRRHFYVRYGVSKQIYSDEPLRDMWLERGTGGVLLPTSLPELKKKYSRKRRKA